MEEAKHFVGGEWITPSSRETIDVINPSTGQVFARIARGNASDIDAAVSAARAAFVGPWGLLSAAEKGHLLYRLSMLITTCRDELAELEARDTGKPLREACADAAALARYFEFYAGAADKLHGDTLPYQNGYTVLTVREPHGVTGHIVPWNYPMQIFGRSIAASLAAGNACVVKPAEDACLSVLRIASLAVEAGLPAGTLNIVTGYGDEAGAALARHPGIDHISFTGSPRTGALVAQMAAEHYAPVTLELGGKSPQIVFADADLDAAMPTLMSAILQNAGQTCSAGSRVLIERAIYEPLVDRLASAFNALRSGPGQTEADCGPLINAKQQQRVAEFVALAKRDGIRVAGQGSILSDAPASGFYQPPTLLADVPRTHRIAREEIFGPVLAAMPFDDEADAVALANDTPYGLVAGVWTRDGARQLRLARSIRAGQVFITNYGAAGGVELPFGGTGHSGFGREKGIEALHGFTTLKTIAIRHG